jgi:hypothetical protein
MRGDAVSDDNPWNRISNADYEKHMGHESVDQLQVLSRITKDQMVLVKNAGDPVVAILGITNGNGLDGIEVSRYRSIIGIDISKEFLEICRERYAHLMPTLQLHQLDLVTQRQKAIDIVRDADLVTANLLVEHIHLDAFMAIIRELERSMLSVTVQVNPDGALVSRSGFEHTFDEVVKNAQECNEELLTRSMNDAGYELKGRFEYWLPNGKSFVRLDLCRP